MAAAALVLASTAACAATDAASPPAVPLTVGGVGTLPQPLSGEVLVDVVPVGSIVPRDTVERPADPGEIATRASGSRVLVIGDSIFASASQRYGGEICDTLVPLGWTVEVAAETGRFIEFGVRVLDQRLRPDAGVEWDVAVVSLGSNFNGNLDAFRTQLHDLLDRLAPRPTLLFTVSEFRADRAQVNEVIIDMLRYYPEVQVVDWAAITRDEPALLSADGLHLRDAGRQRLADEMAARLGSAAAPRDGECLSTSFTDDSAGSPSGRRLVPVTTQQRATVAPSTTAATGTSPSPPLPPATTGTTAAPTTTAVADTVTPTPPATSPQPPSTAPAPPPTTAASTTPGDVSPEN